MPEDSPSHLSTFGGGLTGGLSSPIPIHTERVQVLSTARIDRAHSDRARSASTGASAPLHHPKCDEVSGTASSVANEKATVSGGLDRKSVV